MNRNLRILMLEDVKADADLNERELRRLGHAVETLRVDTRQAFIDALEHFSPDVILSDYALPAFDGLSALGIAKETHPHIPFIFVSGVMGEELAIETLKRGATDYVLKQRLSRLVPAVERALNEAEEYAERKRAEDALSAANRRWQDVIEFLPDATFVIDEDKKVIAWNRAMEEMTGVSKQEMMGQGNFAYAVPFYRARTPVLIDHIESSDDGSIASKYDFIERTGNVLYAEGYVESINGGRGAYLWCKASPLYDAEGKHVGAIESLRDISEFKRAGERLKQSYDNLQNALEDMIKSMSVIVEIKDPYTSGHQDRVARIATAIAKEMGLSEDRVKAVRMASVIHDIGKIYVPSEILSKPGNLNPIEYTLMKNHPEAGFNILKTISFNHPIADIIRQHHERINGSGYPKGLQGDEILLEARIMAVADVVEAMASHRPYRAALGLQMALDEISANRGTLYDPDVVDACLRVLERKKQ
ncbi:MAG: HD domain-containing protein [Smithellaceae bacterium]|nr:HD domain-containing protein [Smithellaceae bacterium]